jgi:aspartate-semialdehyde dehydrogenase
VGGTMLRILEERAYPVRELVLLSTQRSAGRLVPFRGTSLQVREVEPAAFVGVDLALFSAGSGGARTWAPVARAAGAIVIDNSQAFRSDDDVPLVVPEVNAEALAGHSGLIANPNCSTIQLGASRGSMRCRRNA